MKVLTVPQKGPALEVGQDPAGTEERFQEITHGNPPRKTGTDRPGQDGGDRFPLPHQVGSDGGMDSFLPFR